MAVSETELESLRRKIISAFAGVPPPDEPIAPHECDECREIRKTFAGRDWRTLEPDVIEAHYDSLPLFSPAAFRFFLPAYLLYSLEGFSDENLVTEFTIYALTPDGDSIKERLSYWQERFAAFTAEQMGCLYEFLDLVRADESFDLFFRQVDRGRRNLRQFVDPNVRK